MRRVFIVLAMLAGLVVVTNGTPASAEQAAAPAGADRENAARISLGHGTSCVILDNGRARCWGSNNQGQAGNAVFDVVQGDKETPDTFPPLELGVGRTVTEIQTGTQHGCAVLDNGALQCWGRNVRGAVGVPGAVGTGLNAPPTDNPPTNVGGTVQAYAALHLGSCALLSSGSVRCFGIGSQGQNGLGNEENIGDDEHPADVGPIALGGKATAIAGGGSHACAILENGMVRCWGAGNSMPFQPPGPIPGDVGDNELPTDVAAFDLDGNKATAISAGSGSTCALSEAGDVYCWGFGVASRFSSGTNTKPVEPTKVELGGEKVINIDLGDSHACVVFENGTVSCWGDAKNGKLGYGNVKDIGDDESVTTPGFVALGAGRTAKAVSAGFHGTCALLDNDTVRCWGHANEIGSGQPFDIGDDELPTAIPPVNYIGTAAFVPVTPARIFDSRPTEVTPPGPKGYIPSDGSVNVDVTGVGGVPADNIYAVVLNVTITQSGGPGFVTAYPNGDPKPTASNINFGAADQTAPNLVIVPVGDAGQVTLYTIGGGHLIADVFGYYEQKSSSTAGRLIGVTPARVFDTRPGLKPAGHKGKLDANDIIEVKMTDANAIPATGVSAVVLNVTATQAGGPGFVTVFPGDEEQPPTSNVNLLYADATRPNSVIVPVSATGTVKFYSSTGTHLLADITGYYTDSTAADTDDGLFVPLSPSRLHDTRNNPGNIIAANGTTNFAVTGKLGIPDTANAVVLNLTATQTGGAGYVTGWPSDEPQPPSSNLNYVFANETIANLAILPLSQPSGSINLFTLNTAHLIADTSGYHL